MINYTQKYLHYIVLTENGQSFYFNDLLETWENVTKLYLLTIRVLNHTPDCTFARAKLKKYDRMRAERKVMGFIVMLRY